MLKRLIFLFLSVLSLSAIGQNPINVYRSQPSVTVNDAYFHAYKGLGLPIIIDTAHGINGQLDSLGRMFYCKADGGVYVRDTVPTGGHKWTKIGTGSGGSTDSLTYTFIPYWDATNRFKNSPLSTSAGVLAIRGNTVVYFGGVGPHSSVYASFADTSGTSIYNIGEETAILGSGTPQDFDFFQGVTTGKTHFHQGGTDNFTISNGSIRPFVGTAATRTASPVRGDSYYDTDTLCFVSYNGAAWRSVCNGSGGGPAFDSLTTQGGVFHTGTFNDGRYRLIGDTSYAHYLATRDWLYKVRDSLAAALNASIGGKVTNFLNVQQLGFGPFSSRPIMGTALYFSTTDSNWYYINGGTATSLAQNIYFRGQGRSGSDTSAVFGRGNYVYVRGHLDSADYHHYINPIDSTEIDWVQAHDTTSGNALQTKYRSDTARNNLLTALRQISDSVANRVINGGNAVTIIAGTLGAQPAPSACPQCFYCSTTDSSWSYSNGVAWIPLGKSGGSGGSGFNKYLYNLYGSPSVLPILDNVDQYVDYWHGNNSNSGISEALPKQTIASALTVANPAAVLNGSSRIGMRDSSIYHEEVVPSANGIRLSAYRTGYNTIPRLPIITGADTARGWTKAPGTTNVYYKLITNDFGNANPGYDFYQVIETDTDFVKIAPYTARHYLSYTPRITSCDSTAGTVYFNVSHYYNPDTIYIHATGGGSPDSNQYIYEVGDRIVAVNTANTSNPRKNLFIENAIVRDAGTGYGPLSLGDSSFVNGVFAQGGGTHGAVVNSGTINNCVFSNGAVTPAGQITIAFYNATGRNRYNKLTNSVILPTPQAVICHQSGSDSAYMQQFYLENDYMFSVPAALTTGIAEDLCKHVIVRNCYMHGFGSAFALGHGDNEIEHTIMDSITGRSGLSYPFAVPCNLKMWNDILVSKGTDNGLGTASIQLLQDSEHVDIRQSVLYSVNPLAASNHIFFLGGTNPQNTIKAFNNVFIAACSGAALNQQAVYAQSNTNSQSTPYSKNYQGDYNTWIIGPGSGGIKWEFINNSGGVSTTSLATWQSTTGQDLHSTVIDVSHNPLGLKAIFVDPDAGNWQLLPPGTPLADSVRAHSSGLASAITSYPVQPTIEDAVYAMIAGGPPSIAAKWVSATATTGTTQGSDAVAGIVQPGQKYFRTNETDGKLTTTGGPEDIGFSTNNNVIQNNGVWYANNASSSSVNYGVSSHKIAAYSDGYIEWQYLSDSSNRYALVALSPGHTATGFGNFYIGAGIWTSGLLYAVDGYGNLVSSGFTPTTNLWIRIKRTGTVFTIETSPDETTWTVRYTYTSTTQQDLYPILNFDNTGVTGRGHIFYPKVFNKVPIQVQSIPNPPLDLSFTGVNIQQNTIQNIWYGTNNSLSFGNYGISNRKLTAAASSYESYIGTDSVVQYASIFLATNDSAQKLTGVKVPYAAIIYTSNVINVIDGAGGSITSTGVTRQLNQWWRLYRVTDSTVALQTSKDDIVWSTIYSYTTKFYGDLYPGITMDNTVNPSHIFFPRATLTVPANVISVKNLADSAAAIRLSVSGGTNYQTVQANTSSLTARPKLNFGSMFTLADNSGNSSTDVNSLNTVITDGSAPGIAAGAAVPVGGGASYSFGSGSNAVKGRINLTTGTGSGSGNQVFTITLPTQPSANYQVFLQDTYFGTHVNLITQVTSATTFTINIQDGGALLPSTSYTWSYLIVN